MTSDEKLVVEAHGILKSGDVNGALSLLKKLDGKLNTPALYD
jgi:hypothetical protein